LGEKLWLTTSSMSPLEPCGSTAHRWTRRPSCSRSR